MMDAGHEKQRMLGTSAACCTSSDHRRTSSAHSQPARTPPPRLGIAPTAISLHRAGRHSDAVRAIGSLVREQSIIHGRGATETVRVVSAAARLCNELALMSMQKGTPGFSFQAAFDYLQHALNLPSAPMALQAVTLNNFSIYYSRIGQPQRALRCLLRVLKQGTPLAKSALCAETVEDNVSVHAALNMTSILAELGRHREAFDMAQQALHSVTAGAAYRGEQPDASLLCAALHNLAVQQERLGSTHGHVSTYRAAMLAAKKGKVDIKDPMAAFLADSYEKATRRAQFGTNRVNPRGNGAGPAWSVRPGACARSCGDGVDGAEKSGMLPHVLPRPLTAGSPRDRNNAGNPPRVRAQSASHWRKPLLVSPTHSSGAASGPKSGHPQGLDVGGCSAVATDSCGNDRGLTIEQLFSAPRLAPNSLS